MADPADISAIVLAAGSSQRFGVENKLLAEVGGKSVIGRTVVSAIGLHTHEIVVVTGWEAEKVVQAIGRRPVQVVENKSFDSGMGSSLALGVRAASPNAVGLLILLGDMPFVLTESLKTMCALLISPRGIVVSRSAALTGSPVLFGSYYRSELEDLTGKSGAARIWKRAAEQVVYCDFDPEEHRDVDTVIDLE